MIDLGEEFFEEELVLSGLCECETKLIVLLDDGLDAEVP